MVFVASFIDFKQLSDNTLVSFINNGTISTGLSISESVKNALDLNVVSCSIQLIMMEVV